MRSRLFVGLLIALLALVGILSGTAQVVAAKRPVVGSDGRTPISALPFTIDRCGSYFLVGCLTGIAGEDGITIEVDDVTLDLNGFALIGVPGSGDAVEVTAQRSVRVENGEMRGWGGNGLEASLVRGGMVSALTSTGNGGSGIVLGQGGLVGGCTATDNGGDGIQVGFGSTVFDCSAAGNARDGIVGAIAATVTGCVIRSCSVRGNGEDGIETGDGCSVVDCSATLNGQDGITVGVGCVVSGNAATLNGGRGIAAFDSLVRGNAARGNSGGEIAAPGSTVIENHP